MDKLDSKFAHAVCKKIEAEQAIPVPGVTFDMFGSQVMRIVDSKGALAEMRHAIERGVEQLAPGKFVTEVWVVKCRAYIVVYDPGAQGDLFADGADKVIAELKQGRAMIRQLGPLALQIRADNSTPRIAVDERLPNEQPIREGETIKVNCDRARLSARASLHWALVDPADSEDRQFATALMPDRSYTTVGSVEQVTGQVTELDRETLTGRLRDLHNKLWRFRYDEVKHSDALIKWPTRATFSLQVYEDRSPFGDADAKKYELRAVTAPQSAA